MSVLGAMLTVTLHGPTAEHEDREGTKRTKAFV